MNWGLLEVPFLLILTRTAPGVFLQNCSTIHVHYERNAVRQAMFPIFITGDSYKPSPCKHETAEQFE